MNNRTLLDYWFLLYRQRAIMIVVVISAILSALILSILSPKVYEAKTVFFVSNQSAATRFMASTTSTLARDALKPAVSEDGNAPFIGMLKSADLAYRVASKVEKKSAADLIKKDVDIDLTDEYLISIYVRDLDPVLAAKTANLYAEEFNSMLAEMSADSQKNIIKVLESQLIKKRARLSDLQARYEKLEESENLADLDIRTELLMKRHDAWTRKLEDLFTEREAIRRRLTSTSEQLKFERKYISGDSDTILMSPEVVALRSDLVNLESKLQEARLDLSDTHEDVQRILILLDSTKKRLRQEIERISARKIQDPNLFTETLRRQWVNLIVESGGNEAKIISTRNALSSLNEEIGKLPELRRRAQELKDQIEYERSAISQMQSNLDEATAQLQRLPRIVTVVERSRPPSGPKYPLLWLNTIIAALAGTLAAIVLAFYFDYLERTESVRLSYIFTLINRSDQ